MHRFIQANATNGSSAPRVGGRYVRVTRYDGGWDISIAIGDAGNPRARAVAELTLPEVRALHAALGEELRAAEQVHEDWFRDEDSGKRAA